MNLEELLAQSPLAEEHKLNLYIVSHLGFAEPAEQSNENAVYNHFPNFYLAESIELAREMACKEMLELWPFEEGWTQRKIVVQPIDPEFVRQLVGYWQAGVFRKTPLTEKVAGFNCDEWADDKLDTIVETDKPPF